MAERTDWRKNEKNILIISTSPRKGGNSDTLADTIVFATLVYYYEIFGQMKTMLDRSNPLYSTDYAFRDIYLLADAV